MRTLPLLLLALPGLAEAADLTVCSSATTCDHLTIGTAIAAATAGSTITVTDSRTYAETVSITKDLTLTTTGSPTIQPLSSGDVVTISGGGVEATVEGFSIQTGGSSGRAVVVQSSATATLTDLTISGYSSSSSGAGIYVNGATAIISGLSASNLTSTGGSGAAVRAQSSSTVTISSSTFADNTTSYNGAHIWASGSTLTVSGSTFSGGSASGDGGAIYGSSGADVWVESSTFTSNSADDGGAIGASSADLEVYSSTFESNSAYEASSLPGGGAIYFSGSSYDLIVDGSTFTSNTCTSVSQDPGGGAIYAYADSATVTSSTFTSNSASTGSSDDSLGGAIMIEYTTTAILEDNTFTGNSAEYGGAVQLSSVSSVTGTRNLFCANTASYTGGGLRLAASGSSANDWYNNLFVENTGGTYGGGISYVSSSSNLELAHNDFLANSATYGGGMYATSSFTLVNSIIAWTGSGYGVQSTTSSATLDYNDWYSNSADHLGGSLSSSSMGSSSLTVDPEYQAYTQNGDCSDDIFYLETTSDLIGAADVSYGGNNPDGSKPDIGAYGGDSADDDAWADEDLDGSPVMWDCDDGDATAYPGATESCDGVDNDCDGDVDESGAVGESTYYADGDGDGYGDSSTTTTSCDAPTGYVVDATDCDDGNSAVNPGADELCSTVGTDDDCDGSTDEAGAADGTLYYTDGDGDGYGDESDAGQTWCSDPGTGYSTDATDCDDGDADTWPGADEYCDGEDDDCDGTTDEDDAVDASTWYADTDSDGYGDASTTTTACYEPTGYTSDATDCDDGVASTNPGASETCNGVDDDCDGTVDDGVTSTFYADADGDGYGDSSTTEEACSASTGYVTDATDCDDTDSGVFPGADEYCDGEDDDCDGSTDETGAVDGTSYYTDADADGYGDEGDAGNTYCSDPGSGYSSVATDCDDGDSGVNPGADEYCNGADDDCDGTTDESDAVDAATWYTDADSDGYGDATSTEVACDQPSGKVADDTDCDDGDAAISPAADELCSTAGVDDDCDGSTDESDAIDASTWYEDADGDGHGDTSSTTVACEEPSGYVDTDLDCDDGDAAVSPDADEVCNSVDDDCDGTVDEDDAIDASTWYLDLDGDGFGDLAYTTTACDQPAGYVADATDCDDGDPDTNPEAAEQCDDIDHDCDGRVDNDVTDLTWYADTDGDGYGDADLTTVDCKKPSGYVSNDEDCDDDDETVNPKAEEVWYDGVDQDCDGASDYDQDGDGHDAAEHGGEDCDDTDETLSPDAEEVWYDGIDQDCDGASDFDQDGDGFDSDLYGGTDCDDEDADSHPDGDDIAGDGIDQDCDGADTPGQSSRQWTSTGETGDVDFEGQGCGCASGAVPASGLGWLALIGVAGIRRRRSG